MANSSWLYNLPKDWPMDTQETVLIIRCQAINISPAMKEQVNKILSPYGEFEEMRIKKGYAVINFTTIEDCSKAFKDLKTKEIEGHPIVPGRAWSNLSRGRLETILEHQINKVVVKFDKKKKEDEVHRIMETFGTIKKKMMKKRTIHITYADVSSVISAIAIANSSPSMSVEIDPDIVQNLKVKPSIIVLVYDIHELQYFASQDIYLEEDLDKLRKILAAHGEVESLLNISDRTGVVTYSCSTGSRNALKNDIEFNARNKISLKIMERDERMIGTLASEGDKVPTTSKSSTTSTTSTPTVTSLSKEVDPDVSILSASNTTSLPKIRLPPPVSAKPQVPAVPAFSASQLPPFTSLVSTALAMPPFVSSQIASSPSLVPQVPATSLYAPQPPMLPYINHPPSTVFPPPFPAPVKQSNDAEIICTNSSSLEYCKQIRNALRCLDLRVGVLDNNCSNDLMKIMDSLKSTGVKTAIFIDKTNMRENTVSAQFLDGSNFMMRDVKLTFAISEIARLVKGTGLGFLGAESEMAKCLNKTDSEKEQSPVSDQLHSKPHLNPEDLKRRDMKLLCRRILSDKELTFKENTELINYFVEERSRAVHDEYKGFVPRGVRHPAVGPYGDPDLKILREKYESALEELILRNLPEHLDKDENTEVKTDSKNKIDSALKTLLSLDSTQLKSIAGANVS